MKKFICILMIMLLLPLNACAKKNEETNITNAHVIELNGNKAKIDNKDIHEFDYTWHIDPSLEDDYYDGEKPSGDIYIAHDVIYYPELPEDLFKKEKYDGETEWVFHYTNEELKNYVFSTLPVLGNELPKEMMHSEESAYNNPVLHINAPGEYILEGKWNGQIWIDLGEDSLIEARAQVKLILNGVDINCEVAPGLVFRNVYECDNAWQDNNEHSNITNLENAGAKIVLADGTENNITGSNVFRLLKAKYKNDDSDVQKKRIKMDGALYSFESLLIEAEEKGTGILNVTSTTFEGINSELHLTINGGYINVVSQDDGINVNEDDVSVFTMNDGRLTIFAGQGAEGDVVDSNGYIVVNGGTILGSSPSFSDDLLDSNNGTYVSDDAKIIASVAGKVVGEPMPMQREFEFEKPEGFNEKGPEGDFKFNNEMPPDFNNKPNDKGPEPK